MLREDFVALYDLLCTFSYSDVHGFLCSIHNDDDHSALYLGISLTQPGNSTVYKLLYKKNFSYYSENRIINTRLTSIVIGLGMLDLWLFVKMVTKSADAIWLMSVLYAIDSWWRWWCNTPAAEKVSGDVWHGAWNCRGECHWSTSSLPAVKDWQVDSACNERKWQCHQGLLRSSLTWLTSLKPGHSMMQAKEVL